MTRYAWGKGAPAQPGQQLGSRMASPQFLMEKEQHAANMSQAEAAGDRSLLAQQYQQQLGALDSIFGGQNPYQAINSFSSRGMGFQPGSPVYNQQQQQQLINSGVASNQQQLETNLQGLRGSLAGKGFSASSPLWEALMSGQQAATAASNADVRRQVPLEIAQGNATHRLNTALGAEEIRSRRFNDQTGFLTQLLGLF